MSGFQPTARQLMAQTLLAGGCTWIMLFGGGRCVAGDTIIDGQGKTIKELAEIGEPIMVMTTRGVQWAEAPFLKGRCALLEFVLESGRRVEVTPDHRFWNGRQWAHAKDLAVGSSVAVLSSSLAPLPTSSALDLSGFRVDGQHSSQTVADCQDDCSACCHQYGQQPHLSPMAGQVFDASEFDAQVHTHVSQSRWRYASGEPESDSHMARPSERAQEGSQSDRESSHRPMLDVQSQKEACAQSLDHACERTCEQSLCSPTAPGQSGELSCPQQSCAQRRDIELYQSALSLGLTYDTPCHNGYVLDKVLSISETSEKDYYTLHVPVTEQYFANGILHHNSGKTFLIVRNIVLRALKAPGSRHLIVRSRFNHLKASVMRDTFPKVMRVCFPQLVKGDGWDINMSEGFAKIKTGADENGLPTFSEIWFLGLDDNERMEKVLGMEFATIYVNEASQIQWSGVQILLTRLAQRCQQIINGVPRPLKLRYLFDCNPPSKMHWTFKVFKQKLDPETKKPLTNPDNYDSFQMNPRDNAENLSPEYLETLSGLSERMRRRFERGEFAEATPNALFDEADIDKWRAEANDIPSMVRVVVSVDPSGASDDAQNADNDEVGITVEGLGSDGNAYLLEDLTVKAGPSVWGAVAVQAYQRHEADAIVGETNFGGGMVKFVVQAAAAKQGARVNFKMVTASRSKVQRAEPFSVLYSQGKVRHVGLFPKLEDELCAFSTSGYTGPRSPNRADAHIWGLAELFPSLTKAPRKQVEESEEEHYEGAGGWMG